jgi:uncharacterized protein (TIRG00374 family)
MGLLVLGAALLVVLVVQNDPRAIVAHIRQLSWRLAVVICFPAVLVAMLDTLGWRFAFLEDRVPFRWLVSARLAGEAFNLTTPTGAVGGELVKAWLIRPRIALTEGVPSVIVAKTTITIAQGLFLLVGIVLAWRTFASDSLLLLGMQGLLVVEVLALGGFVVAQTRGFMTRGERLLRRLGLYRSEGSGGLMRVDDALARFYSTKPGRLTLSITFHFLAWLLGSIESYLILRFLGIPVTLLGATVIEALGASIRFATFIIPGSLGALEGGYAAIFAGLGLGGTAGVSFTLVRRMREAVWIAIGLVVFALMRPGSDAPGSDSRPSI